MIIGKALETNYEMVTRELAGYHSPLLSPKNLPTDVLNYLNCPLEIDPEAEVFECAGYPLKGECAECKRAWLMQEAK